MSELVLTDRLTRERIRACETIPEGIALALPDRRLRLDLIPDERLAARACRLATRVLSVEFRGADDAHLQAEFTAVWHRVPHTRALPMTAALALTASGVPSYLVHEGAR